MRNLALVSLVLSCVACSEGESSYGQCPMPCGANGFCTPSGTCSCVAGWQNCNSSFVDGCECNGTCNGIQCSTGTTGTCARTTPNSCTNYSQYCTLSNTCAACQPSTFNCDGLNDCECGATGCNGSACAPQKTCSATTPNACQSDTQYCSTAGQCVACSGTSRNCNGLSTDSCECPNGCNGAACAAAAACTPATTSSCGTNEKYCSAASQCVACTGTSRDCNGLSGDACECPNGCNGAACATTAGCAPATTSSCGTNEKYCSAATSQCVACSGTSRDCNGYAADMCECPNGCNGTACTATSTCNFFDNPVCSGNQGQWCSGGNCVNCLTGYFNCDKTGDCECYVGCNGTSCKETNCFMAGTCKHDQVCVVYDTDAWCVPVPVGCEGDRTCNCLGDTGICTYGGSCKDMTYEENAISCQ